MALADGGLSFETSIKATVWGADFLSDGCSVVDLDLKIVLLRFSCRQLSP
jgi:hypothetical protein